MENNPLKYPLDNKKQDHSLVNEVMRTEADDKCGFNTSSESQSLFHVEVNYLTKQKMEVDKLNYCQLCQVMLSASFSIMAQSNQEARDRLEDLMIKIDASYYEIIINDSFLIKTQSGKKIHQELARLIDEIDGDYEIMVKAFFSVKI
ncbi:MAG TPA: hypothetical protein DCF68_12285 [Cyanothece sp. UBA12306]|nr:hypothetical protein [Cyanothece sp. UBA12306]